MTTDNDNNDNSGTTVPYTDTAYQRGMVVQINDRQAHTAGERTVTEYDLAPKREGEILSTARTKTGAPILGDLTPDSIVTVRGVAMRLSVAEREGFVTRDEKGNYTDVPSQARAEKLYTEQEKAEAARQADLFIVDEANAAEVDTLRSDLEAMAINPAQAIGEMFAAAPGDAIPPSFAKLAEARGERPEVMQQRLAKLIDAYETKLATDLIAPTGVNVEEFWQWAHETLPKSDHSRASMRLALAGDVRMYKQMLDKFIAVKGAGKGGQSGDFYKLPEGVTGRVDSKGRTLVTVPVQGRMIEMTFANARNMGFI